jgi:hypothetical protein
MLTVLFWQPERNIDRDRLGHWFRSLIRLFESDSEVVVRHRTSRLAFSLSRRAGDGHRCWVVLSCPRARWTSAPLAELRAAIASEPGVLILHPDDDDGLDVQFQVRDIWSPDAADTAVRIASRALDALGVGADARFDLEFSGEQSMERSLEARKRQREGRLEQW